jgi:hypothetical protein
MNLAAHLYQLQQKDSRATRIEARIREISVELTNDSTLSAARDADKEALLDLQKARLNLKSIENEIQSLRLKIQTSETSLYGGRIQNPKELQDIQKEIASLKHRISLLEDSQLEAMFTVEEMEGKQIRASQNLQQAQMATVDNQASLHEELASLENELKKLALERTALLQQLPQDQIDRYEQLRIHRRGIAVVILQDNACPGCGTTLRPAEIQAARTSQELIFCSTCGRIIFAG